MCIRDSSIDGSDVIGYYIDGGGVYRGFLAVIPEPTTLLGDINRDSVVDVGDLGILGAYFKMQGDGIGHTDLNDDGIVDVADLGILGANWTASQATGNASALVPEPTTLSLLAMSVLMVGRRRR